MSTDQLWRDRAAPPQQRVQALLAVMTLEEKIGVALGDFTAVAHLGLSPLVCTDGPNGIRGPENVTAFPAALALAATFDEQLAAAYGAAVAEEARDTGSNVLLGPAVDIARTPLGGRLPEAMGEDPHLTGRLASAEIRAIQQRHVVSMVKHFIGNNGETGRTGYAAPGGRTPAINTVVGERALQEIYYPPFKAAVQRGGTGSVMGSYNRLNGTLRMPEPRHPRRPQELLGLEWLRGTRLVRLHIDGALVAAGEREFGQEFGGPALPVSGSVNLRAGQPVSIRLDYSSATAWVMEDLRLGGNVRLGWQPPDAQIPDAARLAADSDVAVVFVSQALGEGMDRGTLVLPGDQDALISAVAAANPRTVVVLNTCGPVLMPWLDEVSAVVQAWFGGQQLGQAIAAVLFGDADPGGRLPLTFPATPGQGPITRVERYPGVGGDAHYDEGILVGYRWYDQNGQQPLFPFGHGLSYGDFRYGAPRLDLDESTGSVTISIELTNIGDRPASDVAQLYVAAPPAAGEPPRQLRGFAKVRLAPSDATTVTFELTVDDLAAFDEASGWVAHDGRYDVLVGRSSRDVKGGGALEVRTGKLLQVQGS